MSKNLSKNLSQNVPDDDDDEQPANATVRESADEKMMKALVHQAMRNVLGKRDATLLAVAQQMIEDGEVKEKLPEKLSERHRSDDEPLTMTDSK